MDLVCFCVFLLLCVCGGSWCCLAAAHSCCCCCCSFCSSPLSGSLYHSVAYAMVQHPSGCEIIFGILRAITTVFLWLIAGNRLCWLSTGLQEVGGSIMKKDIKESWLLNIIERMMSESADVQIRCSDSVWSVMEPPSMLRVSAVRLEGCARLSVHKIIYREWFTSAGMKKKAGVKVFPLECLTVAGWFTVSVWLWLGTQNKSAHTCLLRVTSFLSDLVNSEMTRCNKVSDFI